jgi:hypothetical protein
MKPQSYVRRHGASQTGRSAAGSDWTSQRAERDRKRSEIVARYRLAAQPIIKDLASIGVAVDSVWDLVDTPRRYESALPVLMKHFQMDYPDFVREGLARSFARPWARHLAWDQILAAYLSEPNKEQIVPPGEMTAPSGVKEGMAVALSAMAHRSDLDALITLISNPENGPSRIFFVKNLSQARTPEAFDTLMKLSTDRDLSREIAFRLKSKLKRWVQTSQQQSRPSAPSEGFQVGSKVNVAFTDIAADLNK